MPSILLWISAVSAMTVSFPEQKQIERNLGTEGWERERGEISRDQFPVAFPKSTKLEIAKSGLVRGQVTLFREPGGSIAAVGIELLFWSRPVSDGFTDDLAAADQMLAVSGIPAAARADVIRRLTQLAAEPQDRWSNLATSRLTDVDGLVIFVREQFSRGPGGQSGHLLLQFVDARAQHLKWPTVQDIEALQPADRSTMLAGNSDVPATLRPKVRDVSCKSLGKNRWRCRYRILIDDWIGPGRPTSEQSDVFERGSDNGQWRIVGDK